MPKFECNIDVTYNLFFFIYLLSNFFIIFLREPRHLLSNFIENCKLYPFLIHHDKQSNLKGGETNRVDSLSCLTHVVLLVLQLKKFIQEKEMRSLRAFKEVVLHLHVWERLEVINFDTLNLKIRSTRLSS